MRYTITCKLLNEARKKEFPTDPVQIRRYWARMFHDFGPAAMTFLANPRLWKNAPHEQLGQPYIPLNLLPLGLGECRIVFAFTNSRKDLLSGIRQDGFVLTCRWRSDVEDHSRALPHNIILLANKIRDQFGISEFFLWPADCFENTDFSDPDLTGGDSIVSIGSAWISLAAGLLLAKRQIVPAKSVFASVQYDFDNHDVSSVDLIKNKLSVIADFAPSLFYVVSDQIEEAQKNLADLIEEEPDDQRREYLKNLQIVDLQGSGPLSAARAMAFADLDTIAMEKRVRELIGLEQRAIADRRINEAFDYWLDRIQMEKTLALPVSPVCEETITRFYKRSCNEKVGENKKESKNVDSIPEGWTSLFQSPSGNQRIGWRSRLEVEGMISPHSDQEIVLFLSNGLQDGSVLDLPVKKPYQVVWNSPESRIAISGSVMDPIKLVLFHVPTGSYILITDFDKASPFFLENIAFSPDSRFLFVETNGYVYIYETKEGQRIGGPIKVDGNCSGDPWSVAGNGAVFLVENTLFLFHADQRRVYPLIRFVATPDRLFFQNGHCAAQIGDKVWIYNGKSGYLEAPVFNVQSLESVRFESDRRVIFTLDDREEIWQWPDISYESEMIRTNTGQARSLEVSENGVIWILHEDHQLTLIDRTRSKLKSFSNVLAIWPETGSFLLNDLKFRHPQIRDWKDNERFCDFEIPIGGGLYTERSGRYLLIRSSTNPEVFGGIGSKKGKSIICRNLLTGLKTWSCSDLGEDDVPYFSNDGSKTMIVHKDGSLLIMDNESGNLAESENLASHFFADQPPRSPVENGFYRSERIVCEYYDCYRDWYWLSTANGRVFTLDCRTQLPTIVGYQFGMLVQMIRITKDHCFFGFQNYVFTQEL